MFALSIVYSITVGSGNAAVENMGNKSTANLGGSVRYRLHQVQIPTFIKTNANWTIASLNSYNPQNWTLL